MNTLNKIAFYPIKSTQPCFTEQSYVQPHGLSFDREFMLTDESGTFITARKHDELYKFSSYPVAQGLIVRHQDGSQILVRYQDFSQQQECEVWGTHFPSYIAPVVINQWFSEKLQIKVVLRWLGERDQRFIKRFPEHSVSFADGYPLLLVSEASFAAVQQACPVPISINQFRGNLIVSGEEAFAEETWHTIKIGEVEFLHSKLCERCILTTRNLSTGELEPKCEPFRTLKKIHKNAEGAPLFGINLIPLNSGVVRVGDNVEVLQRRTI
ncbi:Fe-S protein [Gallibacterium genomosp. 3]|uniref:Fe-S protein n=1 Tax=Gallibacterium genomosp. 3 TaxID=505345 RepID=A0A1A7NWI0_9PAST|nr:MOSC domain-containing protein [Gallibacterium genomosp. 3]OBW94048.1 Fe-S protein [Gallibacterium genomosp. 3]